jgi:asparagine synthetase B (glutamine-hydrolysing)
MNGIIYPNNWLDIINNNKVLAGNNIINTRTLLTEIRLRLLESIRQFNNKPFCLALSGGIDSSILATVLVRLNCKFTAVTLGSKENHPDVIHAKILQKKLKFDHKLLILPNLRSSIDEYEDLFSAINRFGFHNVICGDTVDEMLGGYWMHNCVEKDYVNLNPEIHKFTYEFLWKDLVKYHLEPMTKYAEKMDVQIALPYLGANDLLRNIDISQRSGISGNKIILRELANDLGVPLEIMNREKLGLCSIWSKY